MTVPVSVQQCIRKLAEEGVSGRQIATRLGVSRNTVAKYLDREDYSPKPVVVRSRSLVEPYAPIVIEWLKADAKMPRKQRHTAKRVWQRLVEEKGFTGSYDSVARWIKRYRLEHRRPGEGFSELAWSPGVAQVDYGQAIAMIDGQRITVHVLVVTFPFSNARFVVASPGETAECVCEGLRTIFEHIGLAPRILVFDNATGVGHRRGGMVRVTRLFEAFLVHYGVEVVFTNPNSGHEKGSVENAVGFLRRNLMVPIPVAQSLHGLSRVFLQRCDGLLDKNHYRHHQPIRELFRVDIDACLALPRIGFDACSWETRVVDLVGNIQCDNTRYFVGCEYASTRVHVGIRAQSIEILDQDGQRIVTHERVYGTHTDTVIDPVRIVPGLMRRPGALRQSPIRPYVPQSLLDYLDHADLAEQRRIWRIIDRACREADFTTVSSIITGMLEADRNIDEANVVMAVKAGSQRPTLTTIVDLSAYDQIMKKRA